MSPVGSLPFLSCNYPDVSHLCLLAASVVPVWVVLTFVSCILRFFLLILSLLWVLTACLLTQEWVEILRTSARTLSDHCVHHCFSFPILSWQKCVYLCVFLMGPPLCLSSVLVIDFHRVLIPTESWINLRGEMKGHYKHIKCIVNCAGPIIVLCYGHLCGNKCGIVLLVHLSS